MTGGSRASNPIRSLLAEPSVTDLWKRGASYDEIRRKVATCSICGESIETFAESMVDEGYSYHIACHRDEHGYPPVMAGQGRSTQSVLTDARILLAVAAGIVLGVGAALIAGVYGG